MGPKRVWSSKLEDYIEAEKDNLEDLTGLISHVNIR
jgi:hypothetical protein